MFTDLVNQFESALCELIVANREQVVAAMRGGYESGEPVAAIAFGVFPWYDSMELSLGSMQDYLEHASEPGNWTHYSVCNSQSNPTDPIARAVTGMVQFYMGNEDEDEEENVSQVRANVIFFAAAKALMSPEFWSVLNPIRLSVIEEQTAADRASTYTRFELREISDDGPSLRCVVTDGDATIRADYCELLKALELLGEHSEEVLTPVIRR